MAISFTRVRLPYGWLGNMAPFPLEWGGATWRTSEALFQARRFAAGDPVRELIRAEKSPMGAKMVAKAHADRMVIAQQSEADLELMADVLRLKVVAHPQLVADLFATGEEEIIEDCTSRPRGSGLFWGAARQADGTWLGANHLGRLWMELRAELSVKERSISAKELIVSESTFAIRNRGLVKIIESQRLEGCSLERGSSIRIDGDLYTVLAVDSVESRGRRAVLLETVIAPQSSRK